MAVAELLPPDTVFELRAGFPGPTRAEEFERMPQPEGAPCELIEGWILPMSPGTLETGDALNDLIALLLPVVRDRRWRLATDARHRLPQPPDTATFPDLAIHRTEALEYLPGTMTVGRVPELVIEILSPETAARDMAPRGAKFRAYEKSGVLEYFYTFPDGSQSAGFRLEQSVFRPVEPDADGFFASGVLGRKLRLVPAALA